MFDRAHPIRSTGNMMAWHTGKPCEYTARSHINLCVYDSTWETSEAFELDRNPWLMPGSRTTTLALRCCISIVAWYANTAPTSSSDSRQGPCWCWRTKGQDSEQNRTKRRFLDEWVKAVNEHGVFGRWRWAVSRDPSDIKDILARPAKTETVRHVIEPTSGSRRAPLSKDTLLDESD